MTRFAIGWIWVGMLLVGPTRPAAAAGIVLPEGKAPPALVGEHFPDRLHEFIWRNWNLVEPEKLAKLVGGSAREISAVAESMGLPPASPLPPEQQSRDYYMLIRRNWHLLPYEQLLELVAMTPERMAFALREDDALWWKLGELKPKCDRLRYAPPSEAARRRAAEIKQVVAEEFGGAFRGPAEPRFHFLRRFATAAPQAPSSSPLVAGEDPDQSLRFIYSYFAAFGDPLARPQPDPYPEGLLQQLSALGVNGVWLSVILRDLAPGGTTFPEFGAGHEQRLTNLRALVERAKKHKIRVYLYFNEPRARPAAFFQVAGRENMAGIDAGGGFRTLCTSNPAVRRWMSDAMAYIFREVPDLGGIFTITTGEAVTSCASYGGRALCPRCKSRTDAEIIAEVNAAMEEGVHRSNPKAKVIAWDWEWHQHGDVKEIVARLPKSMWVMAVSEWGRPLQRGGVATTVNEYALSAIGPGERASRHWQLARESGLKTVAKVQLNNSWEMSTVPYLPVMDLVAEHCRRLASAGVDGMMLSWTHGGYPSPNLEIAARFRVQPTPSVDDVLNAMARERYGEAGAPLARKAWTAFSNAFREFPFDASLLYFCPVHIGPANPLYAKNTGYAATMTGIPYDHTLRWRGPYPVETFVSQFEKVARGWQEGIPLLEAAAAQSPPERRADAQAEVRFAKVALFHFQSVVHQTRFVTARDALADASKKLDAETRRRLESVRNDAVRAELDLARREFALTQEDSRIGFEAANQYFFVPLDFVEKAVNCRRLLDQYKQRKE